MFHVLDFQARVVVDGACFSLLAWMLNKQQLKNQQAQTTKQQLYVYHIRPTHFLNDHPQSNTEHS